MYEFESEIKERTISERFVVRSRIVRAFTRRLQQRQARVNLSHVKKLRACRGLRIAALPLARCSEQNATRALNARSPQEENSTHASSPCAQKLFEFNFVLSVFHVLEFKRRSVVLSLLLSLPAKCSAFHFA